jgi:hypothetical protein
VFRGFRREAREGLRIVHVQQQSATLAKAAGHRPERVEVLLCAPESKALPQTQDPVEVALNLVEIVHVEESIVSTWVSTPRDVKCIGGSIDTYHVVAKRRQWAGMTPDPTGDIEQLRKFRNRQVLSNEIELTMDRSRAGRRQKRVKPD